MARPLRMLAVALSGVLVLTMGGIDSVVAHEFDAASTISLKASKKNVKKKGRVTFSGQVNSAEADCLGGRQVTLVGRKVKSTTTDPNGTFKIRVRPGRTSRWVAMVTGTASGVHPHRHVCGGDVSNAVNVKVKRKKKG
ncbi:MAG: hypothetical protein ACRDKA_09380 [Actinomycetota bacterium]